MPTDVLPETQSQSPSLGIAEQQTGQPRSDQQELSQIEQLKKRGRRWRRGLLVVGLVATLAIAAAFLPGALLPGDVDVALTHTIARDILIVTVTEQGTLESSDNVEIACKVRGNSTVTFIVPSGTEVTKGQELVRLDTKIIEEALSLTKTNVHIATATLAETTADVTGAEIAIDAYLEGRYVSQKKALERELAIAESNLLSANKMLAQSEMLFKRGYVTELELEGNALTVTQADLELKVKQTQFNVLEKYTKEMELKSLNGRFTYTTRKLEADKAGLEMELARRARAEQELKDCVIKADRNGLVIYPSAAAWKDTPDVAEGMTVRKDQVLLLMPDLSRMQVKIGVHESIIDRVKPGLTARVATNRQHLASARAITRRTNQKKLRVIVRDATSASFPVLVVR